MDDLSEFVHFGEHLADTAGDIARSYFRTDKLNLCAISKDDFSPIVTVADREIELALRRMVGDRWPDHGIIGEEFPSLNPDARYVWVFDPIDGTVAFSMGRATFSTLIALFDGDRPILGIIDQPIQKERWIGSEGATTTLNGKPITVSPSKELCNGSIAINGIEHLVTSPTDMARLDPLRKAFHVFCYGGDSYNFGLLASGHIDAVIEVAPDLCDFAAVVPIIQGAGGKITGLNGETITKSYSGGILAASADWVHSECLQMLNSKPLPNRNPMPVSSPLNL